MRRILAASLVLAAACGGSSAPVLHHFPLPTGAALKPYDPSKPGEARPNYTAQLGGIVYAGLTNARLEGGFVSSAGPGFLAAIDPATQKVDLIDLGGADGQQCTNPGVVRADSGKLYVVCSGSFDPTDPSRALLEIDPTTRVVTRRAAIPDGTVPSGIAVTATKIWIGDQGGTNQLLSFDRATFAPVDGADAAHPPRPVACPTDGKFPYVPFVGIVGADVYALCATDTAGILGRYDAATGALIGKAGVGASPTQFVGAPDGRIAVVNSLDNTLSLVTIGDPMSSQVGFTYNSKSATVQDVKTRDRFLFTVASGNNTLQKFDVNAAGGLKVIAEVNTGDGSSPFNVEPVSDDEVVAVNYATSDFVVVTNFQ